MRRRRKRAGRSSCEFYSFADGQNRLIHALDVGEAPPASLFLHGADLFFEEPGAEPQGSVNIVRWNLQRGRATLDVARPGSLAVGGGLAAWAPVDEPMALRARDLDVDAPLPAALTPSTAVPSGAEGLSDAFVVWADHRSERAGAIFAARLRDRGAPGPVFADLWRHADGPVAAGRAARAWLWGPPRRIRRRAEPYGPAPGGARRVRYYDEARMEIDDPSGDPQSPWYVTGGLLVVEMVSGQAQVGPQQYQPRAPATIPVAGDADSPAAPSYAALANVASLAGEHRAADRRGAVVTATLNAAGQEGAGGPEGATVRLAEYQPATGHNVPDVFATYLQRAKAGGLFDPLFVAGYPITEPYWIRIRVAGQERWALMQAFQRRVLTYSPANPPGWQVEMGNVGRHYYAWRYGAAAPRARLALRR